MLTWGVAFSVYLGSHRNLATIAVPGTSKFLLSTCLRSLEKKKKKGIYLSYLERNDERQSEHLPGADNLLGSISKFLGILCKMLSQCISVPKKTGGRDDLRAPRGPAQVVLEGTSHRGQTSPLDIRPVTRLTSSL